MLQEMVCGCRVPLEQYPENAEWGPLFWKLLHGLAEYAGKQKSPLLQNDERRLWLSLLTELQRCLPCDICRGHYTERLKEFPIDGILTMPYAEFGHWVRHHLWQLHNIINEGNDKPLFTWEQLTLEYKGINITEQWKRLEPVVKKAIQLNGITLVPWRKFLGFVRGLQGLYG